MGTLRSGDSCEVNDGVDTVDSALNRRLFPNIAANELVGREVRSDEVPGRGEAEIVEQPNLVTGVDQPWDEGAPDVAGTARDE